MSRFPTFTLRYLLDDTFQMGRIPVLDMMETLHHIHNWEIHHLTAALINHSDNQYIILICIWYLG